MEFKKIHIGSLIKAEVKHCGMTFTEFAKHIGIQRQNVERKIFSQQGLNTDLLIQISDVLNFDFFKYFQSNTNCNHLQLQKEVKVTLIVEMGSKKQDRKFRFVFDEKDITIKDDSVNVIKN
jgi:Plasmid maintenance system antidote protein